MSFIVVLDTNILISGLLTVNGNPFRCLALAKIGVIESVTCPEILAEFRDKLLHKFKFSPMMAQQAINEVRQFSRLVEITGTVQGVVADAKDDMVVECALIGQATHIITGDKRLLEIKTYQNITLLTAAEFITQL
ncbi:putative toxin-antitoxin system toxin component, PIN family [Synechococcus sp. PCC 6312]|uniref:putative toxin-antitoxin system toxin component, PIN family n=1 Tax=Synechococcus sp. (strain ATCC 27167 / PCC 6312) TaxID=195253 RepID=UPI00029F3342|nr:putative toxin-antitoxin system toxin component, PIN family [Synechococcus sp. PCC 6312]AFY59654.1 putative toxin-antitoxin system toxin component, PIN family [Synechococcus sp. PCC 6312]